MSNVAAKKAMDNTSGSGVYNAAEKRYQVLWSIFFIIVIASSHSPYPKCSKDVRSAFFSAALKLIRVPSTSQKIVSIIAIIPILRVISISLSSKDAILKGQVFIWPVGLNTDAYTKALKPATSWAPWDIPSCS